VVVAVELQPVVLGAFELVRGYQSPQELHIQLLLVPVVLRLHPGERKVLTEVIQYFLL
jgi:hypothetical protein